MRQAILNAVDDLVIDFLYYDRKESEHLPMDAIEGAIRDSIITVEEIVERFRNELENGLILTEEENEDE